MDHEAMELYLRDSSHRGEALPGGFDGAAGGAPCGDLVRLSVALERGRVAGLSFDAEHG